MMYNKTLEHKRTIVEINKTNSETRRNNRQAWEITEGFIIKIITITALISSIMTALFLRGV